MNVETRALITMLIVSILCAGFCLGLADQNVVISLGGPKLAILAIDDTCYRWSIYLRGDDALRFRRVRLADGRCASGGHCPDCSTCFLSRLFLRRREQVALKHCRCRVRYTGKEVNDIILSDAFPRIDSADVQQLSSSFGVKGASSLAIPRA